MRAYIDLRGVWPVYVLGVDGERPIMQVVLKGVERGITVAAAEGWLAAGMWMVAIEGGL